MVSSSPPGTTTSPEVTNISRHGLWVLVAGEELFMPFDDFPWFRDAAVTSVLAVEEPHPGHLYWPALDVDLTLEMIRDPKKYPLLARTDAEQAGGADT